MLAQIRRYRCPSIWPSLEVAPRDFALSVPCFALGNLCPVGEEFDRQSYMTECLVIENTRSRNHFPMNEHRKFLADRLLSEGQPVRFIA